MPKKKIKQNENEWYEMTEALTTFNDDKRTTDKMVLNLLDRAIVGEWSHEVIDVI